MISLSLLYFISSNLNLSHGLQQRQESKKRTEEDLLFILAVFTIAVFAILFFFSKEFVYAHLKNQQILTFQTYKACPKVFADKRDYTHFFIARAIRREIESAKLLWEYL